jgi:hypothetical protein
LDLLIELLFSAGDPQVIASRTATSYGVSGALPGSAHDKKARWFWDVVDELEKAGLVTLAMTAYGVRYRLGDWKARFRSLSVTHSSGALAMGSARRSMIISEIPW